MRLVVLFAHLAYYWWRSVLKCSYFLLQMRTEPASLGPVSKVVHLRSLPADVTDSEVIQLGMNYGKVTNVLMLKVRSFFVSLLSKDMTYANYIILGLGKIKYRSDMMLNRVSGFESTVRVTLIMTSQQH